MSFKQWARAPLRQITPVADTESIVNDARATVLLEAESRRCAFPGWGSVYHVDPPQDDDRMSVRDTHKKLGQLASTAICGNDITGSCFYVIGALAKAAGVYAPVAAIMASGTLWLFRWIYTEAVTALPFNGGIYNVLLNTVKNKKVAGLVATLTMLSYLATCVVSALSAGSYMQTLIDPTKTDPLESGSYIIPVAIGLVILFAILKMIGISESATVAAVIFVVHLAVMGILMVATFVSVASPISGIPFPKVASNLRNNMRFTGEGGVAAKITTGFANAMLGVSGFESSANFVEEQEEGVFPLTLRNMWTAVSIINVVLITECVFATDLADMVHGSSDNSLSYLGRKAWGRGLEVLVSVDAFLNLASAVLTSFVGIGGLASRMASDRCLPRVFEHGDRITTFIFASLCISLVLILHGNSSRLSACYSFAFLTVMALFAMSLFILQTTRPKLPREMKNNLAIPFVAGCLCLVALYAAVLIHKDTVGIFAMYVLLLVSTVGSFMYRLKLLKALKKLFENCKCSACFAVWLERWRARVQAESTVVYFTKTANASRLNKAIQYIRTNEDTNYVRIVHVYGGESGNLQRERLELFVGLLDAIYPSVKIDAVFVQGSFGASMIGHLSRMWKVSPSLMFINCPRSNRPGQRLTDLRGVRVIMGHEDEVADEVARARSTNSDDSASARPSLAAGGNISPAVAELPLTSDQRIEQIVLSFGAATWPESAVTEQKTQSTL